MNAFLESLTLWLVDFLVLSTALLTLSLAARLVVRQPGPRVALVWGTWLGIALIAVAAALPAWPRVMLDDLLAASEPSAAFLQPQPPEANLPPVEMPADWIAHAAPIDVAPIEPLIVPPIEPLPIEASSPLPFGQIAVACWSASTAIGLFWILTGLARTRRLLASASKVPQWAHAELVRIVSGRKLPGLWSSGRVSTAVALGSMRPQIILPQASVVESNGPAIRAALAHEWAHIRHGDLWLLALERMLLPLLAAHPLFWWLRRSVRLDQELLADAAAAGEQRVEYAEALVAWARSARPSRHGLAAVGLWENPNTLSRRVAMILDAKRPLARQVSRLWMAVILLLLAPAVVGLSLVTLRPLVAQDKPAPAAEEIEVVVEPEANPLVRRRDREVGPPPKASSVPVTQIHLDLVVMNVDRDKLAAADTTLEDAIAAATESRCRREAGLVVADVQSAEVAALLDTLKKHEALQIISRPKIITLDGREANVQIGGEVPILRVEETVNGKHQQRVEYKEFGTLLMVRPKLSGEKQELVTLDLVAEQSSLLPPGEKAEEGAVPRDVPGLVSHKFKLTAEVKLGGSLLVAESPADKKQLREAVKQQFLVIVTPQRAVREAVAVYSDPKAGEEGEARRKAADAALKAATAAEPEPGTAAAALLKAERDARQKETADLKQKIDALEQELNKLRSLTEPKPRAYFLKYRKPEDVAEEVSALLSGSPAKDRFKITIDARLNSITIQIEDKYADAVQRAIEALDQPAEASDSNPEVGAYRRAVQKAFEALAKERAAGAAAPPPQKDTAAPRAADATRQIDLRLLELDLEQAKLAYETAAKEFARFEQLRAKGLATQQERDARQVAVAQAQIEVRRAETKLEAARAVLPPATSVAVAPASSQQFNREALTADIAQARLDVQRAEKEFVRIEKLKADNAISEEQFDAKRYELERAKIQLRKAESMLSGVSAPAQSKPDPKPTSSTGIRLLELDVAEAKTVLDVTEADLSQTEEVSQKSPGSISQAELRKYKAAVERAKIQLQRATIKLEAAKEAGR